MPATSVTLPLLPATNGVVFPEMVVTIRLESEEARRAVEACELTDGELVLVPRAGGRFATVGTVARIEQSGALRDGVTGAVVRGLRRGRIGQGVVGDTPGLWVEVEPVVEPELSPEHEARATEFRRIAGELLVSVGIRGGATALDEARTPGALADAIGWWPGLDFARKVELLECVDVGERLRLALGWAQEALAEARVTNEIDGEVREELGRAQHEAILRRRLEAIRRELGETEEQGAPGEYREKLVGLGDAVPEPVRRAVTKEIDRLERTGEQHAEASWIRAWLDTVFELPWATRTDDLLDLDAARAVLDADHTGLEEVKRRIVEFLAIHKLRRERVDTDQAERGTGTILVLAGPPGVGKTSLGESVARALGRRFVRTALGGVRDEAEIRGHRRTYVGARPGRIARALIDSGSMNPVILLDEVDKLGADWRGDPTSALLEVLDPAQNHTFRDHYLEFELDLSQVVFVATANVLDRIPAPLLDRMEVIAISGYSEDEKLGIARDHLLPRVLRRNAIGHDEVRIGDDVLRAVIDRYTREAGVRRLEQRLDRIVRRAATGIARGDAELPVSVTLDDLSDALGRPLPDDRPAERVNGPGIATGLAVTGSGGDVLFVEAAAMDGEPGLTLTGQLGDVMRESGEIALSYLRSHADALGIESDALRRRFHVHFPAGAVPKDGPSAGVTMTSALVSLLTDRPVGSDVGMTGEITLRGRVLPIGGVKEKVLAAHRAGLHRVVLPEANRADVDDVPDDVQAALDFSFAATVDDVLAVVLEPGAQAN